MSSEIELLREEVARLKRQLEGKSAYVCPLCKGRMTKSPKFDTRFCHQEFGYCGELVVPERPSRNKGGKSPMIIFHRTTVHKDNLRFFGGFSSPYKIHLFFIVNEEVTKETYLSYAEKSNEVD